MLDERWLRQLTLGLGLGTVVFGLGPLVAPGQFASMFGIPNDGPASDVMIRSIGARDLISGIGILSAVLHGGRVGPWLLARGLADGADAVSIGIAELAGARNPRLQLLGVVAVAATIVDIFLYVEHKRAARRAVAAT